MWSRKKKKKNRQINTFSPIIKLIPHPFLYDVILSSTRATSAQRSALLLTFAPNAKMSCAGHRALAAGVATAGSIVSSSSAASSSSSASTPPSPAAGPRRAFAAAAAGLRNNHRLALGGIAALSASLRIAAAQVSGITPLRRQGEGENGEKERW